MTAAFTVIEPGLATTLQDAGRFGAQRYGVPVSGALDHEALALANALVGAAEGEAALEILHLGPRLEVAAESVRVALCGAPVEAGVERAGARETLPAGRSATLRRGDRLAVGPLRGRVAYLAVAGGFDVAPVLGSRSTLVRGGFGGFAGRPLAAGDRLPLRLDAAPPGPERALGAPFDARPPETVRVVLGPQADAFAAEALEAFLSAEWTVTREADRMGSRLDGPTLRHRSGADIVSDGIVTGAIQVPGGGRPILLLADRQTSGGYPKIATAIGADLPALGRAGPGARFRFAAVDPAEAAVLARAARRGLDASIAAVGPWRPPGEIDLAALHRENLIQPPIEAD